MLPSGLQMLPLLWLLLWTPKLGLSSSQSLGDMMAGLAHEDRPTPYNRACDELDDETTGAETEGANEDSTKVEPDREPEYYPQISNSVHMLGISNDIYKQFRNSRRSVYMVFNATEIQEAVPESASLLRAELQLYSLNRHEAQTVNVFEQYGTKSWRYVRNALSALSNTAEWLSWDVTGVVCQWLSRRGEIEVLRLTPRRDPDNTDYVLHMEISGIPRQCSVKPSDVDDGYLPFLRIVSTPKAQPEQVDCISHH